jgi:hypothetical protein
MASLGEVVFSVVEEENIEYAAEVTERSVEQGVDIVDHVRPRPVVLIVSGVVVGQDAAQKLEQLREYAQKGEVLEYSGRNIVGNMIIQSFPASHTARIADGFSFRLELREIRIAVSETAVYVAPDPVAPPTAPGAVAAQVRPVIPAGIQMPHPSQRPDALFEAREAAPAKTTSLLVKALNYLGKVFKK